MDRSGLVRNRLAILAALAVGEVVGLAYFYRQSVIHPPGGGIQLHGFLLLSCLVVGLGVPYLWTDWLESRGIHYFQVVVIVVLGLGSYSRFTRGKTLSATLDATVSLLFLIGALPRLLGLVDASHLRRRAEAGPTWGGPQRTGGSSAPAHRRVGRYAGVALLWILLLDWFWARATAPMPLWLKIASILPLAWLVIRPMVLSFKIEPVTAGAHLSGKDPDGRGANS